MIEMNETGAISGDAVHALLTGALGRSLGFSPLDLAAGLELAKSQGQRGAHMEALRTYATLVLCDPSHIDCQVGLANCALELAENHVALQAASAIVALAPSDPRGYYLSGRACFAIGAFSEALEDLADARTFARKARDSRIAEAADQLTRTIELLRSSGNGASA